MQQIQARQWIAVLWESQIVPCVVVAVIEEPEARRRRVEAEAPVGGGSEGDNLSAGDSRAVLQAAIERLRHWQSPSQVAEAQVGESEWPSQEWAPEVSESPKSGVTRSRSKSNMRQGHPADDSSKTGEREDKPESKRRQRRGRDATASSKTGAAPKKVLRSSRVPLVDAQLGATSTNLARQESVELKYLASLELRPEGWRQGVGVSFSLRWLCKALARLPGIKGGDCTAWLALSERCLAVLRSEGQGFVMRTPCDDPHFARLGQHLWDAAPVPLAMRPPSGPPPSGCTTAAGTSQSPALGKSPPAAAPPKAISVQALSVPRDSDSVLMEKIKAELKTSLLEKLLADMQSRPADGCASNASSESGQESTPRANEAGSAAHAMPGDPAADRFLGWIKLIRADL